MKKRVARRDRRNYEAEALAEENKRLREALRPFADFDTEGFPDEMRAFEDDPSLVMRHFREARVAVYGEGK